MPLTEEQREEIREIVRDEIRRIVREKLEQADAFLLDANYLDVNSRNFGRHNLSSQLLEHHTRAKEESPQIRDSYAPAQSWVAYAAYPVERGCQLNLKALKDKLHPNKRIGRGAEWYRQLPTSVTLMLHELWVTPRELRGKAKPEGLQGEPGEGLEWFLRIDPTGHIEIGGSTRLFVERDEGRFFIFVSLIGFFWQLLYLTQAIYHDAGYQGEVEVLLNLIGTRGTRLADFADGWASPFSSDSYARPGEDQCDDLHIQAKRVLALAVAGDDKIEEVVRGIASDIGSYYRQDPARCFDCRTHEFPRRQYSGLLR